MNIDFGDITYLAVLVALVISFVMGAAWYGILANPWMKEVGLTREYAATHKARAYFSYLTGAVAWLIAAGALAVIVQLAGADDAADGVVLGLIVGVGFVVTFLALSYSFAFKSLKLFFIDAGYPTVAYAVMGAVLGAWQ